MITVIPNQSILDIAVQESGSVLAAFDWAVNNALSLTDDLIPGQQLAPTNSEFRIEAIAQYFADNKQNIATVIVSLEETLIINYEFPQGEFPISL